MADTPDWDLDEIARALSEETAVTAEEADRVLFCVKIGLCPRCLEADPKWAHAASSRATRGRDIPICSRCSGDEFSEILLGDRLSDPCRWPLEEDEIRDRARRRMDRMAPPDPEMFREMFNEMMDTIDDEPLDISHLNRLGAHTVVLTAAGDRKPAVIEVLRTIRPELGLKDVNDLVDGAPGEVLYHGVTKTVAVKVQRMLEAAGASVTIE
jgi:hypothetical protein